MLWRQCINDDPDIMIFNFGGSGAKFTIREFCLISGLFCCPKPSTHPTPSRHFRDTYFGGRKFPLHNYDIIEVFTTMTYEDDENMVKLALPYFLETVILSKKMPMLVTVKRVDMLDDIESFLMYSWGTLSYHATIKSKREYETIPALAEAFRIKSETPGYKPDVHLVSDKTGAIKRDAVKRGRQHSSPSAYTLATSACQSSPIPSSLDEDDNQCFDEVGGKDVGVSDAHRMCDQSIKHATNHLMPPVSISSSPIVESEHNMKVFTQMSDRKLVGDRRKESNTDYRVQMNISHCTRK
ncbi:hypothetical protein FNV43_RR08201 [Rhamnella rubrinervis]|uniref:DUF1985 domain-containing protein n=1 Tax=Rhamnella rubrinervis TaxID=2594499 RepID=A0A8K0MN60_9ROSA|nr:hypothetical protein FNV43_RR08201 [Rhamnella rubrinervis]